MKKLIIFALIFGGMFLINSPPQVADVFNDITEEVIIAPVNQDILVTHEFISDYLVSCLGGLELKYPISSLSATTYNHNILLQSNMYSNTITSPSKILAKHMYMGLTRLEIGDISSSRYI